MTPEQEARAAASVACWQLGALTRSSRERDIERTAAYILTGAYPEEADA